MAGVYQLLTIIRKIISQQPYFILIYFFLYNIQNIILYIIMDL